MSYNYLMNLKRPNRVNLDDLAVTIDLLNTLVNIQLLKQVDEIDNLQAQLDIIKYRSFFIKCDADD